METTVGNVQMDFISNGQAEGRLAGQLMGNTASDLAKMRPYLAFDKKTKKWGAYISIFKGGDAKKDENYQTIQVNDGTLRREEWIQLDEAIRRIAEERLTGVNHLVSKGLTYNLGNALGTTVFESHKISDAMEAEMTMDGVTRGKGDRPVYSTVYLPIPIIHVDYEINTRVLAASRSLGNPLDVDSAERAARKVAVYLEDMLFTNTSYAFGGGTIYSYVNFPDRNLVTLDAAWDASGKTGAQIVADVLEMKQTSINNYHYGPWSLYIPTAYETVLDSDYDTTTPGTTIRERIMKISGIEDITVVDRLTADNLLLVEMKSETVRLINGMGMTNVQERTEFGYVNKFKVLTIQVPQIRSDYNGKCGIVHMS